MQNIPNKVGRLDEISIRNALERAASEFEADRDNPVNDSVARFLWHKVVLTILKVHGDAGSRVITLMGILCLFSSKILHFRVNKKADLELFNAAEILVNYGLVKNLNVYTKAYKDSDHNTDNHPFIQVELMCMTMAKVIRKVNLPIERRLLEECFKCLHISFFEHSEKEYLEAWNKVLDHGNMCLEIEEYSSTKIYHQFQNIETILDSKLNWQLPLFQNILAKYENRFGSTDAQTIQLKEFYMKIVFFCTHLSDEEKWEQWGKQRIHLDDYFQSNHTGIAQGSRGGYVSRITSLTKIFPYDCNGEESDLHVITFDIFEFLQSTPDMNPEIRRQFLSECVRLHKMVIAGREASYDYDFLLYSRLIHSLCEQGATTELPDFLRDFRQKIESTLAKYIWELYSYQDLCLGPCFQLAIKENDSAVKNAVLEELVKFFQLLIEMCYNEESHRIHKVIYLLMKSLIKLGRESEVPELISKTHDLRFRSVEYFEDYSSIIKLSPSDSLSMLKFHLEIELIRILQKLA